MNRLALAILAIPLMAGQCATTREPEIRTVEVLIPTAVSCVPEGTPSAQPARATLPADTGGMIQAMAGELLERRAYDDAVSPVLAACRRAGAPPDH